jgi:hypothetical protein
MIPNDVTSTTELMKSMPDSVSVPKDDKVPPPVTMQLSRG